MNLTQALIDFSTSKMAGGTGWYDWSIDHKLLPSGISLTGVNSYEQNVQLKQRLNSKWAEVKKSGPSEQSHALEKYYIVGWGQVKTNKPETILAYSKECEETLIKRGRTGIASWSKALTARDANCYAIYDARVAAALWALQIVYPVDNPVRFPLVPGRNKVVVNGSRFLRERANAENWAPYSATFYKDYLEHCRSTAAALNTKGIEAGLYTIEMILFAHAEKLIRKAFPDRDPELNKSLPTYPKKQ